MLEYVHKSNDRYIAGLQPREAYIAVKTIPADTPLSAALDGRMMSLQALPGRTVPSDALTTTAGHAGQVFVATVPAGKELLGPMLAAKTAAGAAGGSSVFVIPQADQAVSIGVCVPEEVAGYITAGSLVDVYATVPASPQVKLEQSCTPDHDALTPDEVRVVQVLSSPVRVLSVRLAPGAASPGSSSVLSLGEVVVTFAANTSQAEQLFKYSQIALPGLTLLPPS